VVRAVTGGREGNACLALCVRERARMSLLVYMFCLLFVRVCLCVYVYVCMYVYVCVCVCVCVRMLECLLKVCLSKGVFRGSISKTNCKRKDRIHVLMCANIRV